MIYSSNVLVFTRMFRGQKGVTGNHNIEVPDQAITEVVIKFKIFISKLNKVKFCRNVNQNSVLLSTSHMHRERETFEYINKVH
jgi:hypothetical protein